MGEMLRVVVAVKNAHPSPKQPEKGGAVDTDKRSGNAYEKDRLLAEALDSTKMPATKGEDGHEKLVPLPPGMLPHAQADALVAKKEILDDAVALGQTLEGADACANPFP